jgi:hypothetical protein
LASHARARARDLRDRVAREAARLLAEGGAANLQQAKLKAAERLGVAEARLLPSNQDVEQALLEYQRLFQPDSIETRLTRLRETAVSAMRLLAEYSPRAVGPVVTGVMTEQAGVCLHLYCDTPEEVRLKLDDTGIPHELSERRWRQAGREQAQEWVPVLSFIAGEVPVELVVLPERARRQPPPAGGDGRALVRMDREALEQALARQSGLPPDNATRTD